MEVMKDTKKDPAKLVRERVEGGRNHSQTRLKQWRDDWKLYRSWIDMSSRDKRRSNTFIPLTFSLVETAAARYVLSMMGSDPIVSVLPRGSDDIDGAFGMELAMQYYLEKMGIFIPLAEVARLLLIYGDGFIVNRWRHEKRIVMKKEPVVFMGTKIGEQEVEEERIIYDGPWGDVVAPFQVYADPYGYSVDSCRWIVVEDWVSRQQLEMDEEQGRVENVSKIGDSGGDAGDSEVFRFWKDVGYETPEGDKEMVLRWRMFEDDHWITIANSETVILDDNNPHNHQLKPVAQFPKVPQSKSFYSLSAIRPVARLQHLINTQIDQVMDRNNMTLHPLIAYDANKQIDPYRLISSPNQTVPVDGDPASSLYVHKIPELTGAVMEFVQYIRAAFDEASGYFGYQRGFSDQRQTATVGSILNEQGDMRIRFDTMAAEEYGMRRWARLIGADIQQFMTDPVQARLTGNGRPLFPRLTPDEIMGDYDYRFTGPQSVYNREVDRAQITEIMNLVANFPEINRSTLAEAVIDMYPSLRIRKDSLMSGQTMPQMVESVGKTSALSNPNNMSMPQTGKAAIQSVRG